MSRELGMTSGGLLRYEQGFHPAPSTKILNYARAKDETFTTVEDYVNRYCSFQRDTRISNYGLLDPDYDFPYLPAVHPLIAWQARSPKKPNLTQIAKAFCVHHATLHRFITQPSMVKDVPTQLEQALTQSGYSASCRRVFSQAYTQWRAKKFDLRLPRQVFND
jgi:hypothetical protein